MVILLLACHFDSRKILNFSYLGIVFMLFFQCASAILNSSNKSARKPLLAYVTFIFSLGTVFTALNLNGLQDRYIQFRNFPGGGPLGYGLATYSSWRSIMANSVFLVTNWFADGLLVSPFYLSCRLEAIGDCLTIACISCIVASSSGTCKRWSSYSRCSCSVVLYVSLH